MPSPLMTFTDRQYSPGIRGAGGGKATVVVAAADEQAAMNTLLGAADANFPYLVCDHIDSCHYLGGDPTCGYKEIVASFTSKFGVEELQVDKAFKWRLQLAGEAVTVKGAYQWPDGTPLTNSDVLPAIQFAVVDFVLYGTRSAFTLATYADKVDHINSDSFLGAPAGTILFRTMEVEQRQLLDGTIVFPEQLHLLWRPKGWNKFYRAQTGQFEELQLTSDTSKKVYEATALAGLLSAP